jgi:hypothetical protein
LRVLQEPLAAVGKQTRCGLPTQGLVLPGSGLCYGSQVSGLGFRVWGLGFGGWGLGFGVWEHLCLVRPICIYSHCCGPLQWRPEAHTECLTSLSPDTASPSVSSIIVTPDSRAQTRPRAHPPPPLHPPPPHSCHPQALPAHLPPRAAPRPLRRPEIARDYEYAGGFRGPRGRLGGDSGLRQTSVGLGFRV